MVNTLLGIKKNMTATYDSRGRRVGATVVEINPNLVTQIKSSDSKDGYMAVQLGYGTKKSVKKPQLGHGKKAGIEPPIRWFREVRINEQNPSTTSTSLSTSSLGTIEPGTEIKLDQVFSIGDAVKVTGISKGKGFQGGVRRHGFHGGPKTHGQSDRLRAPGAIGSGTTPGRVYKGKKMAGHMGDRKVSVKNLEVVGIDKEKNLLVVKGGIPGAVGGLVMVTKLGRIKGYTPPPEEKMEDETVQKDSENSESQKAGESEKSENQNSETLVSPDKSDQSGTQSPSEFSESEVKENAS